MNCIIKMILVDFVSKDHQLWDVYLPKVTCAIHTANHKTTEFTPYFINIGHEMIVKVNVGSSKDDRTVILDLDHYRNMLVRRGENFKKVFADVRSVWRGRILSLRNITISAIGKWTFIRIS